jgi:hypothetical protein
LSSICSVNISHQHILLVSKLQCTTRIFLTYLWTVFLCGTLPESTVFSISTVQRPTQ